MKLQLQKPEWVYFNGAIRRWEEAVLHVSTEGVNRGLSVFEGIRCYTQHDGVGFGLLALPRHFSRLRRSARLLHIPFLTPYADFECVCHQLVQKLRKPGSDMWVRATLFVVEGQWGEGTVSDLVLTAYQQSTELPQPIKLGVSTWRRSSNVSLPARIKAASNYQVGRMARIEGRSRGYSEMILLNQWGRVAEATGSCVLMVRNGVVVTPPASEGALESITLEIARDLCSSLRIPFECQPIDRTELYVAEEIALVGTLSEITMVESVDGFELSGETGILARVISRFRDAARGRERHAAVDLSLVND